MCTCVNVTKYVISFYIQHHTRMYLFAHIYMENISQCYYDCMYGKNRLCIYLLIVVFFRRVASHKSHTIHLLVYNIHIYLYIHDSVFVCDFPSYECAYTYFLIQLYVASYTLLLDGLTFKMIENGFLEFSVAPCVTPVFSVFRIFTFTVSSKKNK